MQQNKKLNRIQSRVGKLPGSYGENRD